MKEEPVKAEHINAFIVPFMETVEKMLGMSAVAKGVSMREGASEENFAMSVAVGVNGRINGEVYLSFGEGGGIKTASSMKSRAIGEMVTYESVGPEVEAALKELANVFLGHTIGKLRELGLESTTISPPAIHVGQAKVSGLMSGKSLVAIPFAVGSIGRVELALCLKIAPKQVTGADVKKIMVVDDSDFQRDVLKMLLQGHGYSVVGEAADGNEAVQRYAELQPDIVTLDIIMPNMDGVDALQKIKEINPAAKVIMVSSISDKERVVECLRRGAMSYILKPYEPEKILETLLKC
ncbi:MAG: response regulator [Nitrospirota bacterium]|nr:response regulator [Nitrospirota bacterium]